MTQPLPSRDQIAELAHDAFFDSEPVPGRPWEDPWPVFADRFLALLDALPADAVPLAPVTATHEVSTVREWGACDIADDPNDPSPEVGGVDPADDEDDAREQAASWAGGRVCWRDVAYGPWRTANDRLDGAGDE